MTYTRHNRVLNLFERFSHGEVIKRAEAAEEYGVKKDAIKEDIDIINAYLSNFYITERVGDDVPQVVYDKNTQSHLLERVKDDWFSEKEILAIIKVLLECRAFNKDELDKLIHKLLIQVVPENRRNMQELLLNEEYHYTPIRNQQPLIDKIWDLSTAIKSSCVVRIKYRDKERDIEPIGLVFSDFYFYLIAYISNQEHDHSRVFRVDRVQDYEISDEHFKVPYVDKFEEGIFRKRAQFMYVGELQNIKLKYWGGDPEPILDRLPNAEAVEQDDGSYIINAEVFGADGLMMWLLTQRHYLEVLEPQTLREKVKGQLHKMLAIYEKK